VTRRGARLVLATAALAWAAAALAALAPSLPEGLAAACAPELVLKELLAGAAVLVLLVGPAFAADDPERGPEEHGGLVAALTIVPAAVALAASGGLDPVALLPAAALLVACDAAASAFLRLDPSGRRGTWFAAAAAALLAGIPIAAYGLAELGGWEGASEAFRASPLLAIRDVAGGWPGVGPAALLLVAIAAVLRFAALRRKAPALAAAGAALLVLGVAPAFAGEPDPGNATVLVVGAPREGAYASLVAGLRARRASVREVDALPGPIPSRVVAVVFARPPRSPEEETTWRRQARGFVHAGGNVVPWTGAHLAMPAPVLGRVLEPEHAVDAGGPRAVVVPLAVGPEPCVNPGLFRVLFPTPPRSLPSATLAFLAVVAASFAGAVHFARRRGFGQARSAAALGGTGLVGTILLFVPGVLSEPFRIDRLVVEERVADGVGARRVEFVRVERLRNGGEDPVVGGGDDTTWTEVRFSPESTKTLQPDGSVRLEAPGRYAILVGISGGELPPPPGPHLAQSVGEYVELQSDLSSWKRSEDPRVSRAGWLLPSVLGLSRESLEIVVPAEGPDAVVTHLR
jgi:hypothetical protein